MKYENLEDKNIIAQEHGGMVQGSLIMVCPHSVQLVCPP